MLELMHLLRHWKILNEICIINSVATLCIYPVLKHILQVQFCEVKVRMVKNLNYAITLMINDLSKG